MGWFPYVSSLIFGCGGSCPKCQNTHGGNIQSSNNRTGWPVAIPSLSKEKLDSNFKVWNQIGLCFQLSAQLPPLLATGEKSWGYLIQRTVQELWDGDGREVKSISLWTLHTLPKHSGDYLCTTLRQPDTASIWQRNAVTKRICSQVGTPSHMTSGCQSLVRCN